MSPDEMPTPEMVDHEVDTSSLENWIENKIVGPEIRKLKERGGLKEYELKYVRALDPMVIRKLTESCGI